MDKISGTYQIRNVKTDVCYIGSSVDIYKRWHGHKRELKENRHHSIYLQRAWNKYGEKNFTFEIVEETEKSKLIECEQRHIDERNSKYNVCKKAGSTMGVPISKNCRLAVSKANKGNKYSLGHKVSAASRKIMSDKKKGKRNWRASLTSAQVIEIRKLPQGKGRKERGWTYKEIAKIYGVGPMVIRDVINRISYKYVTE